MIAKLQPLLLQPAQQEFLIGGMVRELVDGVVQIRMLHAQFDQSPVGRTQVLFHRSYRMRAWEGMGPLYECRPMRQAEHQTVIG